MEDLGRPTQKIFEDTSEVMDALHLPYVMDAATAETYPIKNLVIEDGLIQRIEVEGKEDFDAVDCVFPNKFAFIYPEGKKFKLIFSGQLVLVKTTFWKQEEWVYGTILNNGEFLAASEQNHPNWDMEDIIAVSPAEFFVNTNLVVTRYEHRLADIVLHYNAISSPQEFFDRLHAFSKCEKVDIEETDSVCFTDKYIGGYDRETMIELVVYAQQAEREKDIQKQIDTMIASVRLLTIDLQELAKSVNNRNCGCCYCTPSETGYCTDVFSDPESAMEVSLSVGDGAVDINVKFADGREGRCGVRAPAVRSRGSQHVQPQVRACEHQQAVLHREQRRQA